MTKNDRSRAIFLKTTHFPGSTSNHLIEPHNGHYVRSFKLLIFVYSYGLDIVTEKSIICQSDTLARAETRSGKEALIVSYKLPQLLIVGLEIMIHNNI